MGNVSEEFEFNGMDEFMGKLDAITNEYADTAEKHLQRAGNKLKKAAKDASPIGDPIYIEKNGKMVENKRHHMANRWKSKIVGMAGNELEYQLRNTAPNYHLVERGHIQRTPGGRVTGFVQGRHFFQQTVNDYAASGEYEKEIQRFAKDIKKKIDG